MDLEFFFEPFVLFVAVDFSFIYLFLIFRLSNGETRAK
jgi:hypothetical protein